MGEFDLKAAATNAMNTAKVQQELAAKLQEDLNGDGKISGKEKFDIKTSLFLANNDGSVRIDIDGDGIFDKTVRGLVNKDGTTDLDGSNLSIDNEKYGTVKVKAYLNKADKALKNQESAEAELAKAKSNLERLKEDKKSLEAERNMFNKDEAARTATLQRKAEIRDKKAEANEFKQKLDAINNGRTTQHSLIAQYESEKAELNKKINDAYKGFMLAGDKAAKLENELKSIKDLTSCDYVEKEKALKAAQDECKKAYDTYLKTKESTEEQIKEKDKLIEVNKKTIEKDKALSEQWINKIAKEAEEMEAKLDKNVKADVDVAMGKYQDSVEDAVKKLDEQIKQENKNIKQAEANILKFGEEHAKWAGKFKDALAQNQKDKEVCETDQYKKEGYIASDGAKVTKSQTEAEATNSDPKLKARKEAILKSARTEMETAIKGYKAAASNYHAQESNTKVGGEKTAAKSLAKAKENLGEVAAKYGKTADELINEYDNKKGYFEYLKLQ